MTSGNDVLVIILGCKSEDQFAQDKGAFMVYHGNVRIEQSPFFPYRFTERLIRERIIEIIGASNSQYVALLESAFVNGDCVGEDLMMLYKRKCVGDTMLLCHLTNGGQDMFRASSRFMQADDACFGRKGDILKSALSGDVCPSEK